MKVKLNIVKEKPAITNDMTIEHVAREYTPFSWEEVFKNAEHELHDISEILEEKRVEGRRVPDNKDVFRIFHLLPLNKVRVVILGMDPYFQVLDNGDPVATGLSFSVRDGVPIPSSLKNIFKELQNTVPGFVPPRSGNLEKWCHQGVMLTNFSLTTHEGIAGAHGDIWAGFMKKVFNAILEVNPHCIFVLWGKQAQKITKLIGERITANSFFAAHPSGLSANRGFFGCDHFNKINQKLLEMKNNKKITGNYNFEPIDWKL